MANTGNSSNDALWFGHNPIDASVSAAPAVAPGNQRPP